MSVINPEYATRDGYPFTEVISGGGRRRHRYRTPRRHRRFSSRRKHPHRFSTRKHRYNNHKGSRPGIFSQILRMFTARQN